jgi:hypothetical protein
MVPYSVPPTEWFAEQWLVKRSALRAVQRILVSLTGPQEPMGVVVTVAREAPVQTTFAELGELENGLHSAVDIDDTYPLWPHPHLVGYVQPSIGGGSAPSPLELWRGKGVPPPPTHM